MLKFNILVCLFFTSALIAGIESQNSTAYQECMKINQTNSIVGNWGNKSMGGSTGTYVSLITLSLQDINLEGKENPKGEVSIYKVCQKALKVYDNKNNNFILGLNKIIKQENQLGNLIVFTTLEELAKYQ